MIYLAFFTFSHSITAQETPTQKQLILHVKQLAMVNSENLHYEEVSVLAKQVLPNQQHYSRDIVATLFLLLTDIEINKGNIKSAYRYVQKGLAISMSNKEIKSTLTLKLAQLYVAKKEYSKLLDVAQRAVFESKQEGNQKKILLSLSYRSVALATLGKHKQALINLQEVEKGIASNDFFDNHIELFTILADAYYQLKDYRTALTLQLKILKLRFELQQKNNIEKTYLSIGYANFYLQRFDDAYNAFWEASYYAEKKFAPISAAYAKKGLGIALLKQTQ